jgi:hypothetical protein
MTSVQSFPASIAFEKQLRTLCLQEFPCGVGTWVSYDRKLPGYAEKYRVISRPTGSATRLVCPRFELISYIKLYTHMQHFSNTHLVLLHTDGV